MDIEAEINPLNIRKQTRYVDIRHLRTHATCLYKGALFLFFPAQQRCFVCRVGRLPCFESLSTRLVHLSKGTCAHTHICIRGVRTPYLNKYHSISTPCPLLFCQFISRFRPKIGRAHIMSCPPFLSRFSSSNWWWT